MSQPILEMRAVGKSFPTDHGPVDVLHHVNLTLAQGDFVAITGPSGSGKSTCLHLAALLDWPTAGHVLFDGQEISDLTEQELCRLRMHKVGTVFQKYCLLPHRSVLENVMFRFRYLDHNRNEAIKLCREALDVMGLLSIADRPARLLSGGEMQRVAIARSIVLEPRLLIADEPTGNLDQAAARTVMEFFRQLNQAGITILLVTHNPALIEYCTRHLTCLDGVIAA